MALVAPMKVTFLLHSAYGMGGTIRCNLILANYLAAWHEVEVVTVLRRRDEPFFPVGPRVRLRSLMDVRKNYEPGRLEAWLGRRDSRLIPRYDRGQEVTLRGDVRLLRFLKGLRSDVLVTTRGGYNVLAARFAPRRTVTVGREHLNFGIHTDHMLARISRWYPQLDAVVTQTEPDRSDYARHLEGAATRLAASLRSCRPVPGYLARPWVSLLSSRRGGRFYMVPETQRTKQVRLSVASHPISASSSARADSRNFSAFRICDLWYSIVLPVHRYPANSPAPTLTCPAM